MDNTLKTIAAGAVLSGIMLAAGCYFLTAVVPNNDGPGVDLVKTMYEFETPNDLARGQEKLKSIVTEELYEDLTVDNLIRAGEAYYKFQYSASKVEIVDVDPYCTTYRIRNKNINPDDIWVLRYTLNDDGIIDSVKEYRLLAPRSSGGDLLE